jgi:hypothetical protein
MTIASQSANAIYRLQMSGSTGTVVGTAHFMGSGHGLGLQSQSWIQGNVVIAPARHDSKSIGFWNYPRGGKAFTVVPLGERAQVLGAVSVGSSH